MRNRVYGLMTVWNTEEIAACIYEILKKRKYIFYLSFGESEFENIGGEREINTPPNVMLAEQWSYAEFKFSDNYGSWGLSTTLTEDRYNHDSTNSYISIDGNTIHVTQRSKGTEPIHWAIVVQD